MSDGSEVVYSYVADSSGVMDAIDEVSAGIQSLIEDINGLVEASSALGEFTGIFEEIAAIFTGVDEAAMEATSGIASMAEEAGVAADALSALGADSEGLVGVGASADDASAQITGLNDTIAALSDTIAEDTAIIDGLNETIINLQAQIDMLTASEAEAEASTDALGASVSGFKDSLDMISSSLVQLGSNVGGVIAGRLSSLGSRIQQVGSNISDAVSGPINSFISRIQSFASSISDAASGPINSFISGVQRVGSTISEAVSGPINSFTDGVQKIASTISDAASSAFNSFTERVQQTASNISDAVSGPINNFIGGIQKIGSTISDAVSGPINSFTDGVQKIASNVNDTISGPINNFISGIQSFASDIREAASGPLSSLIDGIQSLGSNINDAVSGPINNFISGIQKLASNAVDFTQNLNNVKESLSGIGDNISVFLGSIGDLSDSIFMGAMKIQMLGQMATQAATSLLGPAASAETMKSAFTTLLGSTQAATDEMSKLDEFASKTPFKTMDIDQAASQLIGFGINAKDVVPDLTAIGDAISAVGKGSTANLDGVVNVFGKIQLAGKLTTADMNQLSARGINAWAVLEKQTGKTQEQLQKMISAGLFPAKDAINDLTAGIEKNPLYAGGMAKQSETAAGLISTLKSNWDQFLAALGTPILKGVEGSQENLGNILSSPALKNFAADVGQKIVTAFQSFGNVLKGIDWSKIGSDFSYLGQQLGPIVTGLKPVSSTIFNTVGDVLKNVVKDVGDFAKHLGDAVKWFKDGGTPATVLKDALIGIGVAIGLMKIGQFVAALPGLIAGVWGWATAQGAVAVATITTALPYIAIGAVVVGIIALIVLAVQHWGEIAHWLQGVWGNVSKFFQGLRDDIVKIFGNIGKWFQDRFSEASKGVQSAFGNTGQWFQDRWKDIQNAFGNTGGWFHDRFQDARNGISGALSNVGQFVKGQWDDQVKGWQIIGQWFHDRFTEAWNAVTGVFGNIGQFLMGIWDTEVKGWTNIGNWFHDRFTEAWNSVTNAFGGIGNWFHNTFTDVYNKIKNIIGNLGPDALKWAQDMINQFVQGIENGVAAVGKAVSKVADKIASFLHHSKPDVGPLADDDTWMPDFMNLLSKGIDDNIDKIKNSALNIATTVSTSVNPSSLPQGPSPTGGMIANEQALQYLAQLVQATQGIQRQQVTPPTSANIGAITQHFGFNVNGVNDLQSLINALNQSQGLQFEYGQRGATFNY